MRSSSQRDGWQEAFWFAILIVIFGAIAVLLGCSPTQVKKQRYSRLPPNLSIIHSDLNRVDAHCRKYVVKMDDGSAPPKIGMIPCCMRRVWSTWRQRFRWYLHMAYGYDACGNHELCHAELKDPKDCAKIVPKYK